MKAAKRISYVEWYGHYNWRLFCVFSFNRGMRLKEGLELFGKWIHAVELAEDRRLSWVAMPERGSPGNFHLHVLIAGIKSRIYNHVRMWNYLAGHCHVVFYDPRHPGRNFIREAVDHCGIDYSTKALRSDDYVFDAALHDVHLLPRFRKLADESN
jgi:hypothetical protein